VFEGLRAYGGTIFKLTEHSERLRRSAHLLGFEVPWSVAEIDAACREVVKANGLHDAYIRPVTYRGADSMGIAPSGGQPHLAIAAWQSGRYFDPGIASEGIRLELAQWRRPPPDTTPSEAKAAGLYMICTLSKQHAERRGYQDALMLDWRGQVAEATGANIFFVREGALHTPVPDCFLDGITRRTIIDLAREVGIDVVERAIWPEELEGFEEVFLTGTAAEVTPVRSIGPHSFAVGAITRALETAYQDLVHGRSTATQIRQSARLCE
jgi:branched-chain amino acid aminotransferase